MSHFYREGRWRMVKMVENAYEMKESAKIGWKKWKNSRKTSNSSWMGHSVELGSWNSVRMGQKMILNLNPSSEYSQIGVFSPFWRNLIFQKIQIFSFFGYKIDMATYTRIASWNQLKKTAMVRKQIYQNDLDMPDSTKTIQETRRAVFSCHFGNLKCGIETKI